MRATFRAAMFLAAAAAAFSIVSAGTIQLRWDPVADADLAGYRVYWGPSSGTYTGSRDVGRVTEAVLDNLADCTTWYVAVKSYDTAGNSSASYSNEVAGWPRPQVSSVSPVSAEQGRTLTLTVAGTNFQAGATLQFSNLGITVHSVSVASCTQLTASVSVGPSASTGAGNVDVTNPDAVFGSGANLFTVVAAAAPTVTGTSPANGATGIAVSVKPTITFSEPMLASSITATTVRLLDDTGAAVSQAAGSPALSSDGRTATVTPSASLTSGKTYRIQVTGGSSGVYDLASHPMSATYTQATGFSTVADTTAPSISLVQSVSVAATTATITWTTDEDSDSQVFFRKSGQVGYQQTPIDASRVRSHSVALQGLDPSSVYEYHARSVDSAGNATTSSPDRTLTTSTNTYSYLEFEAEGGALVSPIRRVTGAGAFGGAWIDTPSGTVTGTESSPAGTASFGVLVPAAGTWTLWVRIYGPNSSSDSWFESVDGAARQAIAAPSLGTWVWVAGRSYTLSAGLHSVELGGREAEARADRILLTNDAAFRPTEQPVDDQIPTAAVSGFTVAPSDRLNTLAWTNPSDGDFSKTIVRYRTDGRYPTSPLDGYAVAEKAASPGSADNFAHTGLTNGTTYRYSAFAVDAKGNVSLAVQKEGQPFDNVAPAIVTNVERADTRP